MKKRIFALIATVVILTAVAIVPAIADVQYGTSPVEVLTNGWTTGGYELYETPWTTQQENPYSLVIYINSQTLRQPSAVGKTWGMYQKVGNTTKYLYCYIDGNNTLNIEDSQSWESYTYTFTSGSTTMVIIPYVWTEDLDNIFIDLSLTINDMQILNNQQLWRMDNYGYEQGYESGESAGYTAGYNVGEQAGYDFGYEDGEQHGYTEGYNVGYSAGEANATNLGEAGARVILTAVEAPFNVVTQWLNFEVLGVNLLGLLFSILAISIIVIILKKVL